MKIFIPKKEYQKLRYWVDRSKGEVGGFGIVSVDDDKDIHIESFLLSKQEVSGAAVEYDGTGTHDLLLKHADQAENMRLQWHSHGNMKAFFSGTDTGNIDDLMGKDGFPWLLSIVTCKAGDIKARVDIGAPFDVVIEDIDVEVEQTTEKPKKTWVEEYDENVEEMKPTPTKYKGSEHGAQNAIGYMHSLTGHSAANPHPNQKKKKKRGRRGLRHENTLCASCHQPIGLSGVYWQPTDEILCLTCHGLAAGNENPEYLEFGMNAENEQPEGWLSCGNCTVGIMPEEPAYIADGFGDEPLCKNCAKSWTTKETKVDLIKR